MLTYFFAYLAGLLTLINPCVLPVLPIVLASSLSGGRRGLIALAVGMSISFVAFGMIVTTIGHSIGLTQERLAQIGAVIMIIFGLILLIKPLAARFEQFASGFANRASGVETGSGVTGQFIGGLLLGLVWSPCIGPTLGGAIGLASQGESLFHAFLIMIFFALGVSTLILGIGLGAQSAMRGRTNALRGIAERSKPILGAAFLIIGLVIFTGFQHQIEGWLLDVMPYWLQDLSVKF